MVQWKWTYGSGSGAKHVEVDKHFIKEKWIFCPGKILCAKHVEVDKHFIKEKIEDGSVCMTYNPSE